MLPEVNWPSNCCKALVGWLSCICTGSQNSAKRCADFKDLDGVSWLDVDFSDRNSLKEFLSVIRNFGPFDGLVNNAGVNRVKSIISVEDLDYDIVHDINLMRLHT